MSPRPPPISSPTYLLLLCWQLKSVQNLGEIDPCIKVLRIKYLWERKLKLLRHCKYSTQQTKVSEGYFLQLSGENNVKAGTQTSVYAVGKNESAKQLWHMAVSVSQRSSNGNENYAEVQRPHQKRTDLLFWPEPINALGPVTGNPVLGYRMVPINYRRRGALAWHPS